MKEAPRIFDVVVKLGIISFGLEWMNGSQISACEISGQEAVVGRKEAKKGQIYKIVKGN